MTVRHFLPRTLPPDLTPLLDQALDLRWNWDVRAKALWRHVDASLWEATGNPLLILDTISLARLKALAGDPTFMRLLAAAVSGREDYLSLPSWLDQTHGQHAPDTIAYFSMEFGLSKALPIYSGGLGILAGDHLKSASDLGIPITGIGLLYQQGYFRQRLDAQGEQLAFYPFNDPLWLPITPMRTDDDEWLRISVDFPGRRLSLRVWQVQVGRVNLYLLDSNDPLNDPRDRGITAELYGGGPEMRLQQEIVLGIGGWRLLEALNLKPEVCHLNEGHAAFAVLQRARTCMDETGLDFHAALHCTRAGTLFTTHTPVEAGFDRFTPQLMAQYFSEYSAVLGLDFDALMALGRSDPSHSTEAFNMAWLALRGSGAVNGVSRLHGEVSRRIFAPLFPHLPYAEVPVGHVTNGVHVPTWDSRAADNLWTRTCGDACWCGDLASLETDTREIPEPDLWSLRSQARNQLVHWVRARHQKQIAGRGVHPETRAAQAEILDPDVLTLGFARRFATYKRPNLLLHDPERLERLLTNPHYPVQLVIAGKAHPQDRPGQQLVRAWVEFLHRPNVRHRAMFIEDYDMGVAAELVHGVDLWLNTPRRPWEASGTSGMKVLANGGLNLSELDGWWAEAYTPEAGWALGDGQEHGDDAQWDRDEAEALYRLLENEIVPAFYQRDEQGLPRSWIARMRESMSRLTGQYSTNRMLREYTEDYYLPAAAAYRTRRADNAALAKTLNNWANKIRQHWGQLRIATVTRESDEHGHRLTAEVYLDGLDPEDIGVEVYADPAQVDMPPEQHAMTRGEALLGAVNAYHYQGVVQTSRPLRDYTVRVHPSHPQALWPLELGQVYWER